MSCSTCHGSVHPTPLERDIPEAHAVEGVEELAAEEVEAVSDYILNVTSDNHLIS